MKMPADPTVPPPLQPGDRVAVVAPAGSCNPRDLVPGLEILRALRLEPVLSGTLYNRERFLAGNDAERAGALTAAFADPTIAGVVCARGGYGAMRVLPHLDFGRIARTPKPLVGFSDITALLWALAVGSGLVGFHGPTVASLAFADRETMTGLERMLFHRPAGRFSLAGGRVVTPGRAQGRLAGGNLTTLCHLLGTPFAPEFQGAVVVLEDRAEAPYRLDRLLSQLRLAGALDGARAVVLGEFLDCGDAEDLDAMFDDCLADLGIPVAAGLSVGHGPRNLTLPMGMGAVLNTEEGMLRVPEISAETLA